LVLSFLAVSVCGVEEGGAKAVEKRGKERARERLGTGMCVCFE